MAKIMSTGPFQKFRTWHLKDRKLIFYIRGKDELMRASIMKDKDKGFYLSNLSYDMWQKVRS